MTAHEARLYGPNAAHEIDMDEVYSRIREAAREGATRIRLVGFSLTFLQKRLLEVAGYNVGIVSADNIHATCDPTADYQVFVATEVSWV
jgi:hypothetical protein